MYAQIAHSVLVRRVRVSLGRARIGVVTALLLAVGASLSCRDATKAAATDPVPVTLRFGVATPKTPDAAIGIRAFVNSLFSESLVGTKTDGQPLPRLASSWEWKDNNLTLELKIRDDLKFQDGTPVDNNYIKDYLTAAFKRPSVSYQSVTRIDTLPGNIVAIRLQRPEALFLAELANTTISLQDPKKADVGLGAYQLLERGPLHASHGIPRLLSRQAEDRLDRDRGVRSAAHRVGGADARRDQRRARDPPERARFPARADQRPRVPFYAPVLHPPGVQRQASHSEGRTRSPGAELRNRQTGHHRPRTGWTGRRRRWADLAAPLGLQRARRRTRRNLEAATLRLDAAGLRAGKVREAGHMPSRFRFKCLTVERNATFEKIAVLVKQQLYEIGVDMEIETVSVDELGARFKTGNYDAILAERTTARSLYWTYLVFHSTKLGAPTRQPTPRSITCAVRQTIDGPGRRQRPAADLSRRSAGHLHRLAESRPGGEHKDRCPDRLQKSPFDDADRTMIPGPTSSRRSISGTPLEPQMRRITYRFVLLIASAAIAPLLLYGIISIRNLQQGTESTVREGNRRLASQVSEEIGQYMEHNTRVLRTVWSGPARHQHGAVAADAGTHGLCSGFPRVSRDHVLRRRRPRHRHEPRRRDRPLDTDRRRHRHQRGLHCAPRSRRGQPAAYDDCHPHRSGRAGAWLDCR